MTQGEDRGPSLSPLYFVRATAKHGGTSLSFEDPCAAVRAADDLRAHGFGDVRMSDETGRQLEPLPASLSDTPFAKYANKLLRRGHVDWADWRALLSLPVTTTKHEPRAIIIGSEDRPTDVLGFVESGFAVCYKLVGRKSIQPTRFALPGDSLDLSTLFFETPGAHACAAAATRIAWIDATKLMALVRDRPTLRFALWIDALIGARVDREWMGNIGQRRGREKIAHLMLELQTRSAALGLADDTRFELPLTQDTLAAALGLSLVHYNKCYASLREEGLIRKRGKVVTLPNRDALVALARFDPAYLNLDRRSLRPMPAAGAMRPIPDRIVSGAW